MWTGSLGLPRDGQRKPEKPMPHAFTLDRLELPTLPLQEEEELRATRGAEVRGEA